MTPSTHHRFRNRLAAAGVAAVTAIATAVLAPVPAGAAPAGAAAGAAAVVMPARPAAPPPSVATSIKGPVGWDTYRRLDRIDELTTGVATQQFSSFDRTGGNNDGFSGTYSCLRTTGAGCVLAERAGAGEIESIWFTRDNGDVTRTGKIRIELDGRVVLNAPLQDVVDGKLGAPFVYPFVANADQSSGGVQIKVPMPYRSSMRVSTTNNPLFYHVTYRSFADPVGVTTFDPTDRATDVIAKAAQWGSKDPKPAVPRARSIPAVFDLPAGATRTLATLSGPGEISELKLAIPQIVGPPQLPLITDDGRAHRGTSTFTVAIDPANTGVTLTRRFDATSAREVADVYVDGTKVSRWTATGDVAGHWSYQRITLPASATANKSRITVENRFVSASIDFNEFHYWVDSVVAGTDKRTDELDVGTSAAALASEKAHGYAITGQTWTGATTQTDAPADIQDPKVLASNALLRQVMVRISFDGQPTVESPLGEFFGAGLLKNPVSALFFRVDTAPNGWYTSWWPMPFAARATVELVNRSQVPITTSRASITWHRDPTVARDLRGSDPRIGYFHATHHRGDTVSGADWLFLKTTGKGRFVGVSQSIEGHIATGNIREYLEGDERVYVDGSKSPQIHGTGSEDFYEAGWYFNRREFSNPMNGLSAMPTAAYGCRYQCDAPYRLMIGDAVPFHSGITFGIEHGAVDTAPADYSSTAYWYGHTDPGARVTHTVVVGNATSEKAHAYTGSGPATTLTARFEGDHDNEPVTADVASTTGPVSFRVAVDRTGDGVVLRRMSDQNVPWQSAAVTVDGQPAGTWLQPLGNATMRWLQDYFQIPPALTADKTSLSITITSTAGGPAWSAASYEVLSLGRLLVDRQPPSGIAGLVAVGTDSNANRLSWSAAIDDVAVDHYEVYASRQRDVRAEPANLVGTPTLSSFAHSGLGLKTTWFYRVRAVDSSGNTGPLSDVVSATTGATLRIEGESLLPVVSATAPAEPQGNCCGVSWSGGQQLWFHGGKIGDTVTLAFAVPTAGSYDMSAVLTRAADYGIAQLYLDNAAIGQPTDFYLSAGVGTVTEQYGTKQLAPGRHTLTLTVTGKNPAASNYLLGLDVVALRLLG